MKTLVAILALLLGGCVGMPDTVRPVENFQLERYLGTWYEIARLDHSFERGLSRVSAEYSLREDGGVRVVNRGYNAKTGEWEQAEGKAFFVQDPQTGFLKVSFFGPFYGAYVIFELDHEGYSHAVVSGPDTSYLWILAREKRLDDALRRELVAKAAARVPGKLTGEQFIEQNPEAVNIRLGQGFRHGVLFGRGIEGCAAPGVHDLGAI